MRSIFKSAVFILGLGVIGLGGLDPAFAGGKGHRTTTLAPTRRIWNIEKPKMLLPKITLDEDTDSVRPCTEDAECLTSEGEVCDYVSGVKQCTVPAVAYERTYEHATYQEYSIAEQTYTLSTQPQDETED